MYLTAVKRGLPVVTANQMGFDMIRQIALGGSFRYF
jgi:hypothetical protein